MVPSMVLSQSARHGPSWSRMLLALSFLLGAFTGTGFLFKQFLSKLKAWIRTVISEECSRALPFHKKPAEEAAIAAAVAARAASAAASEVATANREMIKIHAEERGYVSHSIRALEAHALELTKAIMSMKLIMEAANKARQPIASKAESYDRQHSLELGKSSATSFRKVNSTALSQGDYSGNGGSEQSLEPTSLNRLESAPHSTSYLKVMEMLERGETVPGIQKINDKPPNPDQPPSVSRLQPKPKPWETRKWDGAMALSEVKAFPFKINTDSTLKQGNGASHSEKKYNSVSVEYEQEFANSVPRWLNGKVELENQGFSVRPAETVVKSVERENASEKLAEASVSAGNQEKSTISSEMPNGFEVSRRVWTPPPISEVSMPEAAAAIKSWRGVVPLSGQPSAVSVQQSLTKSTFQLESKDTAPAYTEEASELVADGGSVDLSIPSSPNCVEVPNNLHSQGVQGGTDSSLRMHEEERCSPRVGAIEANTELTAFPACEQSSLILPSSHDLTQEGAQERKGLAGTKQEVPQMSLRVDVQDVIIPAPNVQSSNDRQRESVEFQSASTGISPAALARYSEESGEEVSVAQSRNIAVTSTENLSTSNAHYSTEETTALQHIQAVHDQETRSLHTHEFSEETFFPKLVTNESEVATSNDAKAKQHTVVNHPEEIHRGPVEPGAFDSATAILTSAGVSVAAEHAEENVEQVPIMQSASVFTSVKEATPEPVDIEEGYDSVRPSSTTGEENAAA